MAFMVSPGVNVSEVDLTAGAQQISVSDAAFAGPFNWGPALEVFNIGSEDDLVKFFGKPTDDIYEYWFSAAAFLAYSNLLHLVRAVTDSALNSTTQAKSLTGTVTGNVGSNIWTSSPSGGLDTGYGTTPVLFAGQTVLLDNTSYTVLSVDSATQFHTTVNAITIANVAGTWVVQSGNTTIVSNTGTTALLANSLVIQIGADTLTVNVVTNSSQFTVTAAPTGSNNAASIQPLSYVGVDVATYGVQLRNSDQYDQSFAAGQQSAFGDWIAKYPGELGNSLKVSVCPSANAYQSAPSGSIAVTAGSPTLTGTSGSAFDTELVVGDLIVFAGAQYQIASITNSSIATLTTNAVRSTSTPVTTGNWTRKWEWSPYFDLAPGTSPYADARGGSGDELHIAVIDEDGKFTGIPGTLVESYPFLSKAVDAKTPNGDANYYVTVINRQSAYIWWLSAPTSDTSNWGLDASSTFGGDALPTSESLLGGQTDNANIADGDLETAYDLFKGTDTVDVSLVISGPADATLASYLIQDIAEVRKDCVVFVSPQKTDVVNNIVGEVADIISFRNSLPSSSYGFLDSGWKYTYDKYNDKYRWVPLNGDIAGLAARTDTTNDPWWSPAGLTRGQVKNVVKLAWNPHQLDRDDLYKVGVNSVVSFPASGIVLYGDKTLLSRPSAFDRINVRRLFIVLEKTISRMAQSQLFEFNDDFTRSQFRNIVNPFLQDVKSRRGIYDFAVICDTTNNTAEVIDANQFVGDIYVKPARSINFIQLNFVAVRSGVSFQEVTGAL
ncbi:MAG: phage tail sheath subtilisin-like domain-containing protein [Patescibacteria group bacterium]|nr:phage tail sheath subtilisin-like domain-containing protein [Patescibacteria group bacterium]